MRLTKPALVVVQVVEVHVIHDTVVAILVNVRNVEQGPKVAMIATKGARPLCLTSTTRTPNHQHLGAQWLDHLLLYPLPHLLGDPDKVGKERGVSHALCRPVLVDIVLEPFVLEYVLVGRKFTRPMPELLSGTRTQNV